MSIHTGSIRYCREQVQRLWRRLVRRRVGFLQPSGPQECGAACLAMVLNYFKVRVSVAQVSSACSIGRDGANAATIARVARQFGLGVRVYSLDIESIQQLPLPAILHWRFNHFVTLESVHKKYSMVVDPAEGRRRVDAAELSECFTGVALTFEPPLETPSSQATKRSGPTFNYMRRIFAQPGVRWVLFQSLVCSAAIQLLGLILPLFAALVIDRVLPLRSLDLLRITGWGLLFSLGTLALVAYLRALSLIYLRGRADAGLMSESVRHLFSLPFSFFQQRSTGDLLLRLRGDSALREVLTNQTLSVLLDGIFLLINLFILLWLLPVYAYLVLLLAGLQIVVLVISNRRVFYLSQRELVASAKEHACMVEAIGGIAVLKASGAEERAIDRWSDLFTTRLHHSLRRAHAVARVDAVLTWFRTVSPLALLWVGAYYVLSGRLSLGQLIAMQIVATAFLSPLAAMVATTQQLQLAGAYLQRLADIFETKPEQSGWGEQPAGFLKGGIELRNLSFRYHANAPWVLRNISMVIQPGQKLAIVGPTGSGKSTLAMLLLGMYVPDQGEILYDGTPLSQLDYGSVRRQFGVMLQQPFLFSGSIRENISFTRPGLPLEKIVEKARLAEIHDEIMQMPMGYETLLSEGATNLSGGQRQRIAIARALANEPRIVILDEATSNLDPVTEARIDAHLSSLSCTRIVIAHRPSTVRNADHIVVLEEGKIVESGNHDQLLQANSYYAELAGQPGPHFDEEICKGDGR